VGTTNTSAHDPSDAGEANDGSNPVPATFLGGLRCGALVIKITREQGAILNGTGGSSQVVKDHINRFKDLNCAGEGYAFPQ
jgi:hypothetical protein